MIRVPVLLLLVLGGCATATVAPDPVPVLPEGVQRPQARPDALARPAPPEGARTAEAFDTTSEAERAAAVDEAAVGASMTRLGETVVSLGPVARAGFWIETPLAAREGPGRVVDPASGRAARVTVIPTESGSRLSLAAMRLLELPLTGLPLVEVFAEP